MKRRNFSWDALLMASVVLVAGICSQSQQVAHAEAEGRVVQISPDAAAEFDDVQALPEEETVETPAYWIGIRGRVVQSPVLRTQLQLAVDMGVVVEEVIENSPAQKAGLRRHDIILRSNGAAVNGMDVLQGQVRAHGDKPMELKLIRLGKEETIVVVPEEQPEEFAVTSTNPRPDVWGQLQGGQADRLRQLIEQFQQGGAIDRGALLGGNQFHRDALPAGVSGSISWENGKPSKLTIKRGGETWVVEGDNPESLAQLPEDLRLFAERLFQRGQAGGRGAMRFGFDAGLEDLLPRGLGGLGRGLIQAPRQEPSPQEKALAERLERMDRDLRELQERLLMQEPVTVEEPPAN